MSNHLYRLNNFIVQLPAKIPRHTLLTFKSITFSSMESLQTWETWHRRFGHLGRSSIQTLLDKKLVSGLNVDLNSPKYDCKACTKAKQHVNPFPKASVEVHTKPGKLTHMDLWGKYPVQSISISTPFLTIILVAPLLPSLNKRMRLVKQ